MFRAKHTLLVDLTLDEEALQRAFDADLRWRLRRAEKDGLVHKRLDAADPQARDWFCAFHMPWAAEKGLQPVHRERLDRMAEAGHLGLSSIATAEGETLICSAYYIDGRRVRGLYRPSCLDHAGDSRRRQLMARASRRISWVDSEAGSRS